MLAILTGMCQKSVLYFLALIACNKEPDHQYIQEEIQQVTHAGLSICHNLAHWHVNFATYSDIMTDKKLQEYFPELSVMDFKVLCNIAYHGEIPGKQPYLRGCLPVR